MEDASRTFNTSLNGSWQSKVIRALFNNNPKTLRYWLPVSDNDPLMTEELSGQIFYKVARNCHFNHVAKMFKSDFLKAGLNPRMVHSKSDYGSNLIQTQCLHSTLLHQ